ncbi:arylamine N-acetyltransferase 1 [Chaetomium tenue]|uniref:Arylamine N-acetyltransferase 1 n=1 Tax=Chaetomium tenue TaxID=1854479 RepID=A0ACB7PGP6_9PEZI|nr:arylamine N-acetyltransferase 1 [Chaetomium globosum]
MTTYTTTQLTRYLSHIGYRGDDARHHAAQDPLGCLTALQHLHMARVPFESLSLHYSRHRLLSLDPQDLFAKVVDRGRGGYCMEVNTLFAVVLRTLGFALYSVGGRVCGPKGGYKGWDHMVNIVTIAGQRYLVDVGFGSRGALHPVPMIDGHEFAGLAAARGRLDYRRLEEHADPNQRVWVYSVREGEDRPWRTQYHFVETEFLAADFEVMNLRTMAAPQSFFVQSVMCMWTLLDEQKESPVGLLILHRDYVKRQLGAVSEVVERFQSEEERVKALEKYFGIVLNPEEQGAIRGLASELSRSPGTMGHA